MRLNVGCGNHYAEGWTNVDIESNDQVKPDIQASLGNLPAEIQGVTHVYMGHVLEHIDYAEVPGMLRDLWTRCVPRAKVTIVGPDCTRARELHERSQLFGVDLSAVLYGAGRWQNDVHLWECTPELLTDALIASGVQHVREISITDEKLSGWPVTSQVPWQCAVLALAPGEETPS